MRTLDLLLVDDEALARERLKTLLGDIAPDLPTRVLGEAGNAGQAMALTLGLHPDVVLLDVQMPGANGLNLAESLRALPQPPAIIFVTAHDEFALRAFDVHALDYLLKPVRAARLLQALQRAAQHLPTAPRQFTVQEKGRVILVPAQDVLYLKAGMKYVSLHTAHASYLIEDSLQSVEDAMPDLFVRVHRNALAARSAIVGVEKGAGDDGEGWMLVLRGVEERLPVSRRQWSVVKGLMR